MKDVVTIWALTIAGLTLSEISDIVSIFALTITAGYTLNKWYRLYKQKPKQ